MLPRCVLPGILALVAALALAEEPVELDPVPRPMAEDGLPQPATGLDEVDPADPVYVLDVATVDALARERVPAVAAAQAETEASRADRRAAFSAFYPQLSAGASWRRTGMEREAARLPVSPSATPLWNPQTALIPASPQQSWQGNITVEQSIFVFGRLAAVDDVTQAALQASDIGGAIAERDAALRALIALENLRFARATVGVAQARVDQRQGEFEDATTLFEVGNVAMLDVRETRINLAAARDGLEQARAGAVQARAELARALSLDSDAFSVPDALARPDDVDELLRQASASIAANLDTERGDALVRVNQARAESELVNGRPTLGLSAAYTAAGARLSRLDDDWYVGVGLNWSLYDGGGRYERRAAHLARARAAEAQVDAVVQERQRQLIEIQTALSALAARIALQEAVVEDTARNYEDARALYQNGEITLTRVGQVGLAEIEARFNLNRYRFEESVLAHRLRAFAE